MTSIQRFFLRLYTVLIVRPVRRLYLQPMAVELQAFTDAERQAVIDQAVIGWLQTVLLVIVIAQVIFTGILVLLPPNIRAALGFLHRIEWAAYAGMLLVGAQAARGYAYNLILTNRIFALGWYFGRKMRIVRGRRVRTLAIAYALVIVFMAAAVIYVQINGFIFRATP